MTCPPYICNKKHRTWIKGESQWIIPESLEIDSFNSAFAEGWIFLTSGEGWGLHLVDQEPAVVGVVEDHVQASLFAKFTNKNTDTWHGYPADHTRRNSHIPPDEVLRVWRERRYFTKAKLSKITGGKPYKC